MKTIEIKLKEREFKLKERDFAFIGVTVTVILYIMNVLGTGVIVGGDIGHIGTGLPFYGFVAPFIFIAFAAFTGYYTKKYSLKTAFTATYVTLALPFASYALSPIMGGPLILIPMFLGMPVGSLFTYLDEEICELIGIPNYEATWLMFVIIAVLLLPLIFAPVVYRFTKAQESED